MTRLIPFLAAALAQAQNFDSVRAEIVRQLRDSGTPSLSVAVARDGKIVWEQGFGWANREKRIEATPHTMYSLASISKPFTATGLMVLKQRGSVSLEEPANTYLAPARITGKAGPAEQATLRRIANHTSGLPLHYQFFHFDESMRPPEMADTIRRYGILVTRPGERYEYSNIGYGILDHVIEKASGLPYARFMREEVFVPLGLTHTDVDLPPHLEEFRAVRYDPEGRPVPDYTFDHVGASALYSSAHDLIRFGMFHLGDHLPDQKAILTDDHIAEMQKPTAQSGPQSGYGIGWATSKRNPSVAVFHTGSMAGVATILLIVPSKKIAVVALCNASSPLPGRVANQIVAQMIPGWEMPANRVAKPSPFQPGQELRGQWEGVVETHRARIPFRLTIQPDGDVHARLGSQLAVLVNQPSIDDGWFSGGFAGDVDTPDASRRPHTIRLLLKIRGREMNGSATARSLPNARTSNALTSWVELKRQ
jgi:CubicO group peptidase (beta-lactamase class C family)